VAVGFGVEEQVECAKFDRFVGWDGQGGTAAGVGGSAGKDSAGVVENQFDGGIGQRAVVLAVDQDFERPSALGVQGLADEEQSKNCEYGNA